MIKLWLVVSFVSVALSESTYNLADANNVHRYSPCDRLNISSCPLHCKSPLEKTIHISNKESTRLNELIRGTIDSSVVRYSASYINEGASDRLQQIAFESFCSGWKQRIGTRPDGATIALWSVDTVRQILLAKFVYYNSDEYYEIGSREALLVSPIFKYKPKKRRTSEVTKRDRGPQADNQLDYDMSKYCFLSFDTSLTISSQLAINVIHLSEQEIKPKDYPPSTLWTSLMSWHHNTNNRQQQQHYQTEKQPLNKQAEEFANFAVIQRIQLQNFIGMTVLGRGAISAGGAWSRNKLQIPITTMLANKNNYNADTLLFALEFSAHMGRVSGDSNFLKGVAVANISLSSECLGISSSSKPPKDYIHNSSDSRHDQEQLILMEWPTLNSLNAKYVIDNINRKSFEVQLDRESNAPTSSIQNAFFAWIIVVALCLLLIHVIVWISTCYRGQSPTSTSRANSSSFTQSLAWIWCCSWPPQRVYQANGGDESQEDGQAASKALSMIDLKTLQAGEPELPPKEPIDLDMIDLNTYLYERTNCNSLINDKGLKLLDSIRHIEKSDITIVQLLGQGAFGNVYSALLREDEVNCYARIKDTNKEADKYLNEPSFDILHASSDSGTGNTIKEQDASARRRTRQVAVKMLSESVNQKPESLKEFVDEAINLARASHRNIVQLIGVSFHAKPFYIIMELMMGGNLKKFLTRIARSRLMSPAGNQSSPSSPFLPNDSICMGDLLVFALDIARACNYLSRQGFIHRDLAVRNCLLTVASNINSLPDKPRQVPRVAIVDPTDKNGPNVADEQTVTSTGLDGLELESVYTNGYNDSGRVVKLADFGLTREIQSETDYYLMTMNKQVPVRWMAPECANYKATIKSEVWSFGIVMWEIFSLGRLPYEDIKESDMVFQFLRSLLPREDFNSQKKEQQHNTVSDDSNYLAPDYCELSHGLVNEYYTSLYDHEPPLPYPQPNTPDPIYSIMCSCWALDPDHRPDFDKLVKSIYNCLQNNEVVQSPIKEVAQI